MCDKVICRGLVCNARPLSRLRRRRFVVDSMLEGLARLLRLYGVDAAGLPADVKDCPSRERWRVHRALVEAAEGEGRVVLTKDRIFIRKRWVGAHDRHAEGRASTRMQTAG